MKTGKRLNKKVWLEISFFLKREMSITLVFWLIVFLIVIIMYMFGEVG
jgi:hypothetical protein